MCESSRSEEFVFFLGGGGGGGGLGGERERQREKLQALTSSSHLRSHPHVNMSLVWNFFIVSEADTKFAICNTILTVFAQVR